MPLAALHGAGLMTEEGWAQGVGGVADAAMNVMSAAEESIAELDRNSVHELANGAVVDVADVVLNGVALNVRSVAQELFVDVAVV